MTLPSSEPLPNDINELTPARQRHIRRQPRLASIAERQILLDSLLKLTAPTLNDFLFSLLGALVAGAALYFDEPAALIASIVIFPFLSPVFGLALLPAAHKFGHGLKSLIRLLFTLVLSLMAGILAGWLQKSGSINRLDITRFGSFYWLDLALLSASVFLGLLILLRKGELPPLIGVILSYEILIPLAAAGFGFMLGDARLWPVALGVGLSHLAIAILLAIFALGLFGFYPKKTAGWLLAGVPLLLSLALILGTLYFSPDEAYPFFTHKPTEASILISTSTQPSDQGSSPSATMETSVSATAQSTATLSPTLTASLTPSNTSTATLTPTPIPTTFNVIVNTINGAVIRETPDFVAPVIGYANNGALIEVFGISLSPSGSRWYQVQTTSGETGWLLGSLVNTQTPTPTQE